MATAKKSSKRKSIQRSDPGKILDLVMSLDVETCPEMQIKVNSYLAEECEAEFALQIIVNSNRMEAYIDTVGTTALRRKVKLCMSLKFSEVLKSALEQTDLLSNFNVDFRAVLAPFVGKDTNKKRILMFPVCGKTFSDIVCLVAPKLQEEHSAINIYESFLFVWPTLEKTITLEYECTMKQKCQQLLRVARRLFCKVASLETLLEIATDQAKQLTKAEFCSVLLVDVENMELVETGFAAGAPCVSTSACGPSSSHNSSTLFPSGTGLRRMVLSTTPEDKEGTERRFPMNIGITGQVIQTGTLINAKSAKDHPAYDPSIDTYPGIDCKTLLCFPIREQTGIIGVGHLINKVGDPYFDAMDEEMALAFSIYCGVCITHSVVYQKIQEAHTRNALANELVMYHMKVSDPEVAKMLECTGFHNHPHISSLHFNPRAIPLRELPCYVMKMYADLGYINKFNIKKQKLARFILHVKKGYRDVPFHNWLHAFNVAQWAFAALVNYKLVSQGYLSDLQALMYLTAGLVHDLDHRGTTNSFHLQGQTTLAALYSSEGSVMERHHLAQAMCILNTEGCDILESLHRKDYDRAIMMLRDYILASDLANYFKYLSDYRLMANDFQKGNRMHTSALQSLLMNAADLSDQLKDWGSVKKTAAAVLTEFFKQGDVEKSRGDLPAIIMDRDKCFIPDLEIQFLNMTCVPLFDILGRILPKAQPCMKIVEKHIETWIASKPIFAEVPTTAGLSVLLSPELDNLIDINLKEKERLRQEEEQGEQPVSSHEIK